MKYINAQCHIRMIKITTCIAALFFSSLATTFSEVPNDKSNDDISYTFKKNVSRFTFYDGVLYATIENLVISPPAYAVDSEVEGLLGEWGEVAICAGASSPKPTFWITIYNRNTDENLDRYKIDIMAIKQVDSKGNRLHRYGFYINSAIAEKIVHQACADAKSPKQSIFSNTQQRSPGTESNFSNFDPNCRSLLLDILKNTKAEKVSEVGSPMVTIGIFEYPIPLPKVAIYHEVYIHERKGLLRVVECRKIPGGNIEFDRIELGYFFSNELWLKLCETHGTRDIKHQK